MTIVSARILALSFSWVVMSAPLLSAQDLSKYREFQLGMSLATAAQQSGVTPVAQVPHQRAELIQELLWQPPRGLATSPPGDSVRKVLLSFYNGQLFRIAVSYDWEKTEGMTVEDMIEALSAKYGLAILPNTDVIPLLSRVAADSDRIVAHWEDAQYSLNLVRPSYASTFGLVMLSKRLDALVRAATVQSLWLHDQEASARAIGRKQNLEDADHARQEQVRARNKAIFRFN
jgi:hypothetical protein